MLFKRFIVLLGWCGPGTHRLIGEDKEKLDVSWPWCKVKFKKKFRIPNPDFYFFSSFFIFSDKLEGEEVEKLVQNNRNEYKQQHSILGNLRKYLNWNQRRKHQSIPHFQNPLVHRRQNAWIHKEEELWFRNLSLSVLFCQNNTLRQAAIKHQWWVTTNIYCSACYWGSLRLW